MELFILAISVSVTLGIVSVLAIRDHMRQSKLITEQENRIKALEADRERYRTDLNNMGEHARRLADMNAEKDELVAKLGGKR